LFTACDINRIEGNSEWKWHENLSDPHRQRLYSNMEVEGWEDCIEEGEMTKPHIFSPTRDAVDEMQFHVNEWTETDSLEKTHCISGNLTLALAAFDAAVQEWPNKHLTCQHGSRVLREHKGK
jgi:hypothetical protein